MSSKNNRFVRIYKQGSSLSVHIEILVDRVTGVNYLCGSSGYGYSICPLLNRDGSPVISPLPIVED